jgi:diguanylate cyclase (GGDEF)-like protein
MCLPLIALGEMLGVLHVRGPAGSRSGGHAGGAVPGAATRVLDNVAESIALTIANIRRQDNLQHQAIRDPLTQLFNRRYLGDTLKREIHRVSRSDEPLTVAMLDVDHFKIFNDSHGHDAGDSLLKAIGSELAEQIRGSDIACRYGGEEFVLVYPGMNADVAATRLETIRQRIERLSVPHRGLDCARVTISAGIAVYPDHASDAEALVKAADTALYASKDSGRNRVTMAQDLKTDNGASRLRLVEGGGAPGNPPSAPAAGRAMDNVLDLAECR